MSIQISFASHGGLLTPTPDLSIEVDNIDICLELMKRAGFPIEYGPANDHGGYEDFLSAIRSAS